MTWRAALNRGLLAVMNSRLLNDTPCKYGFIGNVDAFSIENLRSEVRQRPGLTVAQLITEAEQFAACSLSPEGPTVIAVIEDGVPRSGTIWDVHELRKALGRDVTKKGGEDGS